MIVMVSERLLGKSDIRDGFFLRAQGQFRSYNITDGAERHLFLTVFVREITVLPAGEENLRQPDRAYGAYLQGRQLPGHPAGQGDFGYSLGREPFL